MPAYFMQNIANSMHKYKIIVDSDGIEKLVKIDLTKVPNDNQSQFIKSKMALSYIWPKWHLLFNEGIFKVIDSPHYLESYYTLTKEISVNDFGKVIQ